jgi:CheY-like chemotaxis protein
MTVPIVRIGGASGAWGDSPRAIPQLLAAGPDYLMMDYLAEVTMSLLARARMKNPDHGFPPDFVAYLKPWLADIAARGVKVVSNAGGVNPAGCKEALEAACAELDLPLRVAMVTGDDLMPVIDTLRATAREAATGAELPVRLLTANAYLGALPIAAALGAGADIVLTGRCADSALALGILMHEFGWSADDYDRLAAGSLVGHLLECGPQATGGNHTDWQSVPNWEDIGYPIAECRSDGAFILTKPAGTGGLVTPAVVAEQTLYEIGDPASYVLPDVVADFSGVTLDLIDPDRVLVKGATGRGPTAHYKVSATWQDGYRATATVSIVGPDAVAKAMKTAQALIARGRLIFAEQGLPDFTETHIEPLGGEAAYGPLSRGQASREIVLRIVMSHPDLRALDLVAREVGSLGLGTAPGVTGIFGGRPKPSPVVRLYTFFLDKAAMPAPTVTIGEDAPFDTPVPTQGCAPPASIEASLAENESGAATTKVALVRLAYARSGDKGDSANIAIIARYPELMEIIRREVTVERMAALFADCVAGPVRRYEAPGLHAFNFVLENALGGGGMASMRIDPQGKAYGQRALEMDVCVPAWVMDLLGE